MPQVGPPLRTAARSHTMRARLGNVILGTTVFLLVLISVYAEVATNVVPYWWVAAAVVALIGLAAHHVLTRDR
jgi:protein-S-isoprenylcysteine O-methyltransferase Ste14